VGGLWQKTPGWAAGRGGLRAREVDSGSEEWITGPRGHNQLIVVM
jgi:hypothetical protein